MDLLKEILSAIKPLDELAMNRAQHRLDSLTKPQGSLGRLEEMARQFAGITGEDFPAIPRKCVVLAVADHGVAEFGVSAYPVETTAEMTRNYLVEKGAGANALANFCGADMVVVDVGIKADMAQLPGLWNRKIAYGTRNFVFGPAMTRQEAVLSVETGIEVVCRLINQGYRCFGLGEMGIGNTTSSAAVIAAMGEFDAAAITGRGTGISDARFKVKLEAVQEAIRVNRPDPQDAIDVLAKVGGYETGALAGVILGAAANRCLVVLDGVNAGASALIAHGIHRLSREYMLASHLSAEPAHSKALEMLGLKPFIDMGMRLGEATGACLAMNFLDVSLKMLREMATFAEAGVSGQREV